MENENNIRVNKVAINATEIINKYKKLQDRLNFCFERNWFHPKEVGFDANFFLLVIKGDKKYLPNNFSINYKFNYFRKGERMDKRYLIDKMRGNPLYSLYTPDSIDPMKFSKNFLLRLIGYIDPELFAKLYSINKNQNNEKQKNNWSDFKVEVNNEILNDIKNFQSINNNSNNYGGFKRSKNHKQTDLFHQFRGNINNNKNYDNINSQIRAQLNQMNQANNQLMQEREQLKQKIAFLEKNIKDGENELFGKEVEMKDEFTKSKVNNKDFDKQVKIKFNKK